METVTVSIVVAESELAKSRHSICTMGSEGDTLPSIRLAESVFTVLSQHHFGDEKMMRDTVKTLCDLVGVEVVDEG
jgi:hypothetical protein